jgi:hypothetical protein
VNTTETRQCSLEESVTQVRISVEPMGTPEGPLDEFGAILVTITSQPS